MSEQLYPIKLYLKHVPNLVMLAGGFLINIAVWIRLLWSIRPQEDLIFLHYTVLFGVDLIGEWWRVLYIPLGGFLILLFNAIIGWILFQKDRFANYVVLFVALLSQILLFISATLLVYLNV